MSSMNCIEISSPGGPEVLALTQRAIPEPKQGEILIKVAAAGVNRPDILQRKGFYPPPEGASDLPGLEVAGTVEAVGGDVGSVQVGDKVCALLPGGGYAEYAIADHRLCLPIPDGLTFEEAACLPETFFTVWTNVFEDGALKSNETLLVHGGASGIGTTALLLAKAKGAQIIATAGTDEKCDRLRELGATAYNYKATKWDEEIIQAGGLDVILDMVGGDYVERNINCLKPNGRHVSIAFLNGIMGQVNVMTIMRKRLTLTGSTLRARSAEEKARLAQVLEKEVWPLFEKEDFRPMIDSRFPLKDAAKAHERMETSDHFGKIVLYTDI